MSLGVRRMSLGVRRMSLGVRRMSLGVRRMSLGVRRMSLGVRRGQGPAAPAIRTQPGTDHSSYSRNPSHATPARRLGSKAWMPHSCR